MTIAVDRPVDESAMFLRAGPEHLHGILTRSFGHSSDLAVLLVHNGMLTRGSRLWPNTARALAADGFMSLRLDLHGGGDSSGTPHDRDASGQSLDDIRAGVSALVERGARRVLVVGRCWAGLVSVVAASQIPAIVGLALITPPLQALAPTAPSAQAPAHDSSDLLRRARTLVRRDTVRLLRRDREYRRWMLQRCMRLVRSSAPRRTIDAVDRIDGLRALRDRNVVVHAIFGRDDEALGALDEPACQPVRATLGTNLLVTTVDGEVHYMRTRDSQRNVLQFIRTTARDMA